MNYVPSNYSDEEVLHLVENTPVFTEAPLIKELCDRFWRAEEIPDIWYTEEEMDEADQKIAARDDLLADFVELVDDLEEHTQGDFSDLLKRFKALKLQANDLRS